jgi:hypothetical protein
VAAWQHTGVSRYGREAVCAYTWFLGRNRAGARMYVDGTGGCHDGLSATDANPNQGAESTLAYYQALLSLVTAGLAALPDRVAVSRSTRAPAGARLATTGTLTAAGTLSTAGTAGTTGNLGATDRRAVPRDRPVPPAMGQSAALRRSHRTRKTEGPADAR